jgi:hypothetical protein
MKERQKNIRSLETRQYLHLLILIAQCEADRPWVNCLHGKPYDAITTWAALINTTLKALDVKLPLRMLAASLLFCETCKFEYRQQLDMQVAVSGTRKYSVFLAAVLVKIRTLGRLPSHAWF